MWDELGIAPTTEAKAIRRAYAARLRTIDVDRDPQAFQRLRQAYDWALYRAAHRAAAVAPAPEHPQAPVAEPDEAPVVALRVPAPVTVQAPPVDEQAGERAQILQAIREALAAGDAATAFVHFDRGMALGLLPLGVRDQMLDHLMKAALNDATLSGTDFAALMQRAGWSSLPGGREFVSPTRHAAMARAEAEIWLARLKLAAEGGQARPRLNAWHKPLVALRGFLRARMEQKNARLLLGEQQYFRLLRSSADDLERKLAFYRHYRPSLGWKLDADDIARADAMVRFERRWGRLLRGTGKVALAITVGLPFITALFLTGAWNIILPGVIVYRVARYLRAVGRA